MGHTLEAQLGEEPPVLTGLELLLHQLLGLLQGASEGTRAWTPRQGQAEAVVQGTLTVQASLPCNNAETRCCHTG